MSRLQKSTNGIADHTDPDDEIADASYWTLDRITTKLGDLDHRVDEVHLALDQEIADLRRRLEALEAGRD
ncbi:hypothetical protein FFK22_002225 [Mycobacterium sp. KBS0706]|uniref:hypothetical protein n=1 Tax=Mycobacterium sp. KBS0706 TaxID=2578109 RepID=UPI00110FD283|nr:hypothetical protein [Mycobacterium sp. KBS0706]TSD90290.1 hypothetical protein FFK22_002225 [Mycobacterium sp. KBS0706]